MKKNIWETISALTEKGMDFDVSDTPQEKPPEVKKKGPPPVPVKAFMRRKDEAPVGVAPTSQADMQLKSRRSRSATIPMGIPSRNPAASPSGAWMVTNPKTGEKFRVEAGNPEEAQQLVGDMMADELAQQGIGDRNVDVKRFKVEPAMEGVEEALPDVSRGRVSVQGGKLAGPSGIHPSRQATSHANPYGGQKASPMAQRRNGSPEELGEGSTGANGAGFQLPVGDAAEAGRKVYENALRQAFRETVRKLPNGKFGVYVKNKGKKKAPKKVGEFPDRVAAREAELARGGKSGDSAKKERDRLAKLKKDPKKLAAAKKKDSKKPKAKTTKESIIDAMVDGMNEALFREEDIPGSPWDERLAGLTPNAMASDKKLAGHAKAIDRASGEALMDAVAMLQKALKKQCKCKHGELGTETGGKKFIPVTLDIDGEEHGPLYMYVDGGHVRLEMADELDESLDGLEDGLGHNILGAIMSFKQKQLPKVDKALKAVAARDAHLNKVDRGHDEHLSGMSGVDLQIIKNLINTKHGRRFR